MSSATRITFGRLEDVSIHDLLGAITRPPPSMRFALITSLDSCLEVAAMLKQSPLLEPHQREFAALGSGVTIPTERLLTLNRTQRLFFGFDEIFFFGKRPRAPKPSSLLLVDPKPTGKEDLSGVKRWFLSTECFLGVGDGTGLNFIGRMVGRIPQLLLSTVGESVPSR